ncbi:MAG: IclR family transcriptional regulator [Anaerolineaceae bacterium]|nr:IclR family transcriptional regulator [Anaerolineaceae bacterium]
MDLQPVSTVDKVLDILMLFSSERTQISMTEIQDELSLSQSTAYRYIRILVDRGFLERVDSGNYRLGATLIALSRAAHHSDRNLRLAALPSMKRIAEETRESVSLMRLVNRRVVCIESLEGQYALRVTIEYGRTQHLHSGASSKVLLAFTNDSQWDNLLDFPLKKLTENTITESGPLYKHLKEIRRAGYAVSDGEIDVGARAVAVPIMNRHDQVAAALSIEAPASRMDDTVLDGYIALLQDEAQVICDLLK